MPPSHRSILPSVPGVPAGAAVLIAVTCTFIGFFLDARGGSDELTGTFSTLYVIGCLLAVLVVRFKGVFTTMVLPPLLLFVSVPLAYQQMLGSTGGLKDVLLNLAIPLVSRFPTMALATVLVLAIGGARIYLHRRERDGESGSGPATPRTRTARPGGSARSQRTRSADAKDPARRRSRAAAEPDAAEEAAATARPSRRPGSRVAANPPRVGSGQSGDRSRTNGRQPGDRSRGDRKAGADRSRADRQPPADRNPGADRAQAPEGRRRAAADRKPPADRQPGADRTQVPEGRRRAKPPADRNPATGEPRRRAQNPEVPPHPRPNVRYRERDSGRIER